MKASEIKVGGIYKALVSNKLVSVRVTSIDKTTLGTRYNVLNLVTSRKCVFRSAAKFRSEVIGGTGTMEKASKPLVSVMDQDKPLDPHDLADTFPIRLKSSPVVSAIKSAVAPRSNATPHLIVKARAGTGKTTTLVEGLKVVKGLTPKITPSEQQKAVWDSMAQGIKPETVAFCAFNSSIAAELKVRVPSGVEAMTIHSMGYRAVRNAFPRIQKPDGAKVDSLIAEIMELSIWDAQRSKPVVFKSVKKLVELCKQNLSDDLDYLVNHYEVELSSDDGVSYKSEVYSMVPCVLERCKQIGKDTTIDFNDMVWLPVVLNLPCFRYDLLIVDEAQDLNRSQQALAKKCGTRLVLCGDDKQAIYGFAGADSDSLPRMFRELSATSVGCIELPLTVTRRCGKVIVEEARKYVPDFSAHESNPEGSVAYKCYNDLRFAGVAGSGTGPLAEESYRQSCKSGDMVLCRVNAPLVSQCFKFLREGRKAVIQGRDIGEGLIRLINKMKAIRVEDLIEKLETWSASEVSKEMARKAPNESKIIGIQDKVDCLMCFTEGCGSVDEVIRNVNSVFTDDKACPGIRLSSVHKAKGLEAKRVFILQPEGASMPHPMARSAWQVEQEYNLLYVAITRAIEELVYVS